MNSILDTALALAAEGVSVFPLVHGTKIPSRKSRGLYDATTDPVTINRWFGGAVRWNLGARCGQASKIFVLDADNLDSLEQLKFEHGPLPVTRQSQSSRGAHFWFRYPIIPLQSSKSRVGPGLDIQSDGNYVVVPPSIHPSSIAYEWASQSPIAEPPSWLCMLARKPAPPQRPTPTTDAPRSSPGRYGAVVLANEALILAKTKQSSGQYGGRNNQLNVSAFKAATLIADGYISPEEIEKALIEACNVNGLIRDDGLSQCLVTIRSGVRAGMRNPRTPRDRP